VVHRVAPELNLLAQVITCPHDLEAAAAVVREQLARADPPTAFLCLADSIAFGVYAAARDLKLVVPEDVSVVGYDDLAVSRLLTPPLSSYRWPIEELVEAVVSRTVAAIETGRRLPRAVIVPRPMPRSSVAAPRR
jgi:LacI family transcriptional regulator